MRKQTRDRRIQRTDALLQQALGTLIREKPYQDIAVKEILSRANVGRSTFYTHFADKDELLLSCIHDMLRSSGSSRAQADPLWFSLPVFQHIERHRENGHTDMESRGQREMHEHLRHAIVELIQDKDRAGPPAGDPHAGIPALGSAGPLDRRQLRSGAELVGGR